MTEGVQTISTATAAEDAWHLMRERRIHHLVVKRGSQVVGVLSERDVGGRRGAAVRQNRQVADLMTAPAVTVPSDTTVRKAANLMRGQSIGCLVVSDAGRVAGIVTVSDLLELVGRGSDRKAQTSKRWTLKHRAPHRHRRTTSRAGIW
jgi:CBS domain-containing protein